MNRFHAHQWNLGVLITLSCFQPSWVPNNSKPFGDNQPPQHLHPSSPHCLGAVAPSDDLVASEVAMPLMSSRQLDIMMSSGGDNLFAQKWLAMAPRAKRPRAKRGPRPIRFPDWSAVMPAPGARRAPRPSRQATVSFPLRKMMILAQKADGTIFGLCVQSAFDV